MELKKIRIVGSGQNLINRISLYLLLPQLPLNVLFCRLITNTRTTANGTTLKFCSYYYYAI